MTTKSKKARVFPTHPLAYVPRYPEGSDYRIRTDATIAALEAALKPDPTKQPFIRKPERKS